MRTGGTNLVWFAWRNLWRHKRRTFITASGLAFGFFLAILLTGISDAGYGDMIDYAARLRGGHITIQHHEYLDSPTLTRTVTQTSTLAKRLKKEPGVVDVVSRISGELMLATAGRSYGASFIAYNPEAENEDTFTLLDSVGVKPTDGKPFESGEGGGIILGARLAKNLGVRLGKKVVYTLTDKNGEMATGLARVSGLIRTGGPSVDGAICLLPIDSLRKTLGYARGEATSVAVFLEDHRDAPALASKIQSTLGDHAAALVWNQTQPDLASFISMKVNGSVFIQAIIALLIAAVIFITLFMSVMERMREFGILTAIGFSPARLSALVLLESAWLAAIGLLAGAMITAGPYVALAKNGLNIQAMAGGQDVPEISGIAISPIMPFGIYPENAVIICVLLVVATMLSGVYPAWKASRVVPVETINTI